MPLRTLTLLVCNILFTFSLQAQDSCFVRIKADTCISAILEAKTSDNAIDTLIWYKGDNPIQLRIQKGYNNTGVFVAGTQQGWTYTGDICMDSKGFIYVSDHDKCQVTKWKEGDTTGEVVAGFRGCGINADQLNYPQGIAVDSADNLYVTESISGLVSKWAPGAKQKVVVAKTGLESPYDLCFDKNNNLYIVDFDKHEVTKWVLGATTGIVVAGGNGRGDKLNQLFNPVSVCIDSHNNLYIADEFNYRVVRWAPGAQAGVVVAGGNGSGYGIDKTYPVDIFLDEQNNLFISDLFNHILWWPRGSSYGITVAGGYGSSSEEKLYLVPGRIMLDKQRNLYVLGNHVTKFTTSNKIDHFYTTPSTIPYYVDYYSVKAKFKNGCESTSKSKFLNTYPETFSINGAQVALCGPVNANYNIDPVNEALSYEWQAPSGTTVSAGQGTRYITLTSSDSFTTGSLYAFAKNGCGSRPSFPPKQLTSIPSKPGNLAGPKNVRTNQQGLNYKEIFPEANVTYTWTVPADANIIYGQGTDSIIVNWGSTSGSVTAVVSTDCGTPNRNSISRYVTVNTSLKMAQKLPEYTGSEAVVYPQPAKDKVKLQFTAPKNFSATIQVTDIMGKRVMQQRCFAIAGKNFLDLNIASLASGQYFITISNNMMLLKGIKLIKN